MPTNQKASQRMCDFVSPLGLLAYRSRIIRDAPIRRSMRKKWRSTAFALRARRLARAPAKRVVVDVTAVYWHFMDALWIYILLLLTVRS